jgi:hypothetical protein
MLAGERGGAPGSGIRIPPDTASTSAIAAAGMCMARSECIVPFCSRVRPEAADTRRTAAVLMIMRCAPHPPHATHFPSAALDASALVRKRTPINPSNAFGKVRASRSAVVPERRAAIASAASA